MFIYSILWICFSLLVNCWPSETKSGCDVSIEYELQKLHLELKNVLITVPLPYVFFVK